MKERPIIFNSQMVRAILKGHKTQTRRVIKPQPTELGFVFPGAGLMIRQDELDIARCWCPYGDSGDRLWVRETHFLETRNNCGFDEWQERTGRVWYAADGIPPEPCKFGQWEKRPSIHMFRKHSRILLKTTDVRIERIQDISERDAQSEGLLPEKRNPYLEYGQVKYHIIDSRTLFKNVWDSINAERGYKEWIVEPFTLWCWGKDEHDDPESICLDIASPEDILWRESEYDDWQKFGCYTPPDSGYYFVIWESGDEPRRIYLWRGEATEGRDYIFHDYSWASNPWVWVVSFEVLINDRERREFPERRGQNGAR